jgi:hypothetical protein
MSSLHCRPLGITRPILLLVVLAVSGVLVLGRPALAQEVLTDDLAAPPAVTGNAQSGETRPSPATIGGPSGMAVIDEDEVCYDGSTFRIMLNDGSTSIIPGQGIPIFFTDDETSGDASCYEPSYVLPRIVSLLQIHARRQAAASPPGAERCWPIRVFLGVGDLLAHPPADSRATPPTPQGPNKILFEILRYRATGNAIRELLKMEPEKFILIDESWQRDP